MTIANKYYNTLVSYGIEDAMREGKAWYPRAYGICKDMSKRYDITPERAAAIMAVTSPRARWQKNVEATLAIIEDARKPKHKQRSSYGILGANAAKGILVANDRYYSRHVTGPKVTNFYLNILGHVEPVTVDAIMSKAAGYGSDVNNGLRNRIEYAVESVADVLSMSPRDTQAAVWIAFRGSAT